MTVPRGAELHDPAVLERAAELDRRGRAAGVGHLRGDGALPDQLVEGELVAAQLAGDLGRGAEPVTRGTDGLVRLLGVLDLLLVAARCVGDVLRAIQVARLLAGRGEGGLRQRGAVGAHVGDVAVLVEPLGDAHGVLGGQPQLARGLLLEGARRERRGGAPGVGLLLDAGDLDLGRDHLRGNGVRDLLVEVDDTLGLERAVVGEVAAGGHAGTVDRTEPRTELVGRAVRGEVALDVPVGRAGRTPSARARARPPCGWRRTARDRRTGRP